MRRALEPVATSTSALGTTRRNPNRASNAAANGPMRPNSSTLTETANPMSALLHPNSSCNGSSRTAGDARNPAASTSTTSVPPNTTHA